jgi:hypothetical protein
MSQSVYASGEHSKETRHLDERVVYIALQKQGDEG